MSAVAVALAVARELHVGRIAEEDDALDAIVLGLVEEEALALATRPVVRKVVVEVTLAATIVVVAIGSVLDTDVAGKALFGRTASQVAAPHRKADALGLSVAYLTAEKEFGYAITLAGPVLADDGRCPAVGGCKAFHGLIGHRRIDDTGEDSLCLLDRDSGCELAQSIGEGGRTGSTRVGFGLEAALVLARSCRLGDPSGIDAELWHTVGSNRYLEGLFLVIDADGGGLDLQHIGSRLGDLHVLRLTATDDGECGCAFGLVGVGLHIHRKGIGSCDSGVGAATSCRNPRFGTGDGGHVRRLDGELQRTSILTDRSCGWADREDIIDHRIVITAARGAH